MTHGILAGIAIGCAVLGVSIAALDPADEKLGGSLLLVAAACGFISVLLNKEPT